ncbi:MAG: hypothetical protein SGILL_002790 [Bacillariaceae sp.]
MGQINLDECMGFPSTSQQKGNRRHLQERPLGSYNIRQQQQQHLRGRPLTSSFLRNNAKELAFVQIPKDEDVTSPPYRMQEGDRSSDADDSNNNNDNDTDEDVVPRQTGNPLINQKVPVDLQMVVSVQEGTDYGQLILGMEAFLEEYLEQQYQRLIEQQSDEFSLTTDPILRLQEVDLTVLLVEFPPQKRLLRWIAGRSRALQVSSQMARMNVEGQVAYNVEVDGGSPTPEDIEQEWNGALNEIMAQPRLDEVITQGGVDGVVRVDQVVLPTQDEEQGEDTPIFSSNSTSTSATASPSSEEIPWQDSQSGQDTSSSDLTRPSTLSIVFGFLLTGIAALGLVGYCYIFYRKRKKRLRKKQQIKDTITYPARNLSVPPRSASANRMAASQRPLSSTQAPPETSPMRASPMILSPVEETFSEDTSYKGVESSIASEDAPDAFAEELQKAASLDQQAWDEFQKRKHALDSDRETRRPETDKAHSARALPSPLLGRPSASSDDERVNGDGAIETDVEGRASFAPSFPYGDEGTRSQEDDDDWVENPITPRSSKHQVPGKQWEPYNSALPPSPTPMEEKKDESSPTEFFAKELHVQNIEMDLARYGRSDTGSGRDDLSNVDVVSEVEELSRYVRRYEQRKDRRYKREVEVHEKTGTNSMSIGMDGQIYETYQSRSVQESMTPSSVSTMSSLPPPPESDTRGDLTSYTGSYLNERKSNNLGSLSFVSDDEESEASEDPTPESSIRSQRLGISPFSVAPPDEDYYSSFSKEDSSTPPVPTRAPTVPPSSDDYRYSVGYGYTGGSNNNGIHADKGLSSKSSMTTTRLSNLRANNAIIDGSNSDVNFPRSTGAATSGPASQPPDSSDENRSGFSRMGFRRSSSTKNSPKSAPNDNSPVQAVPIRNKSKKPSNKTFDRLRGMFEQKTTEQPAPIYPPGEHWQFEGHKKT